MAYRLLKPLLLILLLASWVGPAFAHSDPTSITGALINSGTGKLELFTGKLKLAHLKDSDRYDHKSGGVSASTGALPSVTFDIIEENKQGITRATIGAGSITIRDVSRDEADALLDLANRDPAKFQQILVDEYNRTVGELDFEAIKNLPKNIAIITNALKALTIPIPENVAGQGSRAEELFRKMIANGLSPEQALRQSKSREFARAVQAARNYRILQETGGDLSRADMQILALSELAVFANVDGELTAKLKIECGLFSGNCELIIRDLNEVLKDPAIRNQFLADTLNGAIASTSKDDIDISYRTGALLSALMACSVYEPEVFQRFIRGARKNGQWHKLAALAQAHFGSALGKKASELYAQLDININKVQSDYEKTNWFFQLFSDLENDSNEKLETLVNNDKSLLFMAGSHLVMVSAFIEAEDAAKAISDPVKRQQMLDGLAKAWEFAKENPGAAGLEGISAIIKGTVEDAWNVTSHTVESIAQNTLGEDPLDAGLASSAALVAAIAFINPIRKGTKAAKALLKRAKEARRFYDPKTWRKHYEDFYNGKVTSTTVPPFSAKNVQLAGKRHPKTGVVFDERGFPIFDKDTFYDTRFTGPDFQDASYSTQMRMATRDLRDQISNNPQLKSQFEPDQLQAIQSGKANIPRLTWHHHQDRGRMQLVDRIVHRGTGHIGGEVIPSGQ